MHIPACETKDVDILTFEDACAHKEDSAVYDREKWLYIPDFYSEYRYILGTSGSRPLITIGINPSFIMFNVYAQRATDPDQMDKCFNEALHRENMLAFRYVLERSGENPVVWAAWGTIVEKRDYLKKCLQDMVSIGEEFNAKWVMAGKPSKKGHPHHPLYLKKDSIVEDFDMEGYLSKI